MRKIFNNYILYQTFLIFIIVLFFIAGNVKYSFSQVLWQQTNGPLGGNVPSLAINNTSGAIFAGGEAGVFRSDNNGDSWTSISTGLPTEPILNIAINSSGHIFTGSFMGSLHRSMDNGATWELKNNGLPPDFEIMTMVINSTDSIFVASFNGIYRSADNGENWSLSTTGLPYPEMNVLYVAPNGNVLGGNFNGVYETADDALSVGFGSVSSGLVLR